MSGTRIFVYFAIFIATAFVLIILWFALGLGLPKNLIVLPEDPQGKVGVLEVKTEGGQQVLSKSHQATGASSASAAPKAPFIMSDAEINEIFGDVINGRPDLPVTITLNFQRGQSILATSGEQINEIIAEVQRRAISSLSIYGYASTTGNVTLNLGIALLRARAVGRALASQGLDSRRFIVESFIDQEADVSATNGVSRPDNLRVDVVIR